MAVSYSLGELNAEQMLDFEEHLLGCALCRTQVSELRLTRSLLGGIALQKRIKSSVGSLARTAPAQQSKVGAAALAKAEGGAPSSAPAQTLDLLSTLTRGLESATRRAESSLDAAKRSRLLEWGKRLAANAQQMFERISGAGASAVSSQLPPLEILREIGWAWLQQIEPLTPARIPSPTREAPPHLGRRKVPAKEPAGPAGVQLRLESIPGSKDVELIVNGLPANAGQLIALLIPKNAPDKAQDAMLRRVGETHDEWTARFRDVPPGDYALAIEPLSNSKPGQP
jgi:hypothetical protein